MSRTVLITGASGALGLPLLTALLQSERFGRVVVLLRPGRCPDRRIGELQSQLPSSDRIVWIAGDVVRPDLGLDVRHQNLTSEVDVIIHAAANTRFSAPADALHAVNVGGTGHVLAFARRCRRLEQFLLVSTTCVAGTRTGVILERQETQPVAFVNQYERSKWQAERLAAAADLPVRIARLSSCIGDEHTGQVHRFGAIHQALRWLARGLVPMLPAVDGSRVDLIATGVAARWIARAAELPVDVPQVCHVAAGEQAIPLRDLVDCTVAHLRETVDGWSSGQIEAPMIVDLDTFRMFERSVAQSGDVLFARVLDAASTFFPALLYPKVYRTVEAERIWGGPLPLSDWRSTIRRVVAFGCRRHWRRARAAELANA